MSIPKDEINKKGFKSKIRSDLIDATLALLASENTSGKTYTAEEIAQKVGTSKSAIRQIELKAMKRLRHHLKDIHREWFD